MEFLRSHWNGFWFFVRRTLRFRRGGYSERTVVAPKFSPESLVINTRYNFTAMGERLSPPHWHRALATLWYLEQMFLNEKTRACLAQLPAHISVAEPGCQNFSRLAALRAFFKQHGKIAQFTGIELDAFVPLKGFHSLWDHAQYYVSLENDNSQFIAEDFFKYKNAVDVIVCFYPFVSAAPALAWGLPATIAGASQWIEGFIRNLKPNGYVFVVHQGDWEEKDFDEARQGRELELIHRQVLVCPFFSTKHPAHGSLYRRKS